MWLTADWGVALQLALAGLAALAAIGVVATVLGVVGLLVIPGGGSEIRWVGAALTPFHTIVTLLGGDAGVGVVASGFLYAHLGMWAVGRRSAALRAQSGDRYRLAATGVKAGVLVGAAGFLLGIALEVVDTAALSADTIGWGLAIAPTSNQHAFATLFFAGILGSVLAGSTAAIRAGGLRILAGIGLDAVSVPTPVRAGASGAFGLLRVALPGVLALWTIGTAFELWGGFDGTEFRLMLGLLLSNTLMAVVTLAFDISTILLLGALKFLGDGGYVWAAGSFDTPAWAWLGVVIALAAFAHGGVRAARRAEPTTVGQATGAAAMVGPVVAGASLVIAVMANDGGPTDDIVAVAMFLPVLWAVVSVVAAWLWASQQGLAGASGPDWTTAPNPNAWTPPVPPATPAPPPSATPPPPPPPPTTPPPPPPPEPTAPLPTGDDVATQPISAAPERPGAGQPDDDPDDDLGSLPPPTGAPQA